MAGNSVGHYGLFIAYADERRRACVCGIAHATCVCYSSRRVADKQEETVVKSTLGP